MRSRENSGSSVEVVQLETEREMFNNERIFTLF